MNELYFILAGCLAMAIVVAWLNTRPEPEIDSEIKEIKYDL